ncbi:MAG: hypothetical protein PHS99_04750 [Candidatus Marinimicrobia bacterium]|nr:hypothetical protein [Candidatus Neomarinimicrobiota bacterium]
MLHKRTKLLITFLPILFLFITSSYGQIREYKIHNRGMLHQTVFNTGEIGRAWQTGEAGNKTSVPLFEWPSYSKTILDGIEYDGQHNIIGAGVYIGVNKDGEPGEDKRIFALCGGVGSSTPEVAIGRWSFPIYMEKIENYPLLEDGTLNPDYDSDEAEEIIRASWATSTGITVTRVSRMWSYPDYDDMIIYEYEFEYTGDTDGNPATLEMDGTLKDVMICFNYGFAPSMYGYQRTYMEWKYEGGIYRGDQNNFWDADYWLTWNMNLRNNISDPMGMAKPELNVNYFKEFAQMGIRGGGLNSPQAPGYCVLFYDTTHLAKVIPQELDVNNRNESEAQSILRTSTVMSLDEYSDIDIVTPNADGTYTWYYELDEYYHVKQPWVNKVSTGNTNSAKMMYEKDPFNPTTRWSGVYAPASTTWPELPHNDDRWIGRAAYPYRQSADAAMKLHTFGPYTLEPGNKLYLAYAEVVGYGAQPNKRVEGGQVIKQWDNIPDLNRKYIIGGETVTEHYLDDFGYPDYINSDSVITVHDVAKKAFEAYLGYKPQSPVWPENHPPKGNYKIPVPVPAPVITLENYGEAEVKITWSRAQEAFTHPRLMGTLSKYYIWRAEAGMGPWALIDSIHVGSNINENNEYEYIDSDQRFKVGESRYYAVTSVDEYGHQSGKTNIIKFKKDISPVTEIGDVYVVPNPYIKSSGFIGEGEDRRIGFYGLPNECTIRIYSYAGQLIDKIEHNTPTYSEEKIQVTRNGQDMASGIYFFIVTTPEGQERHGKFVILK